MSDLTYQDVLSILRLIDAAPFSDLDVEFGGTRLKVSRRSGASVPVAGGPSLSGRMPNLERLTSTPPSADSSGPSPASARAIGSFISTEGLVEIKPPMAGTFYAAPSPGAPPFVAVGQIVAKGDQLGVVEVMKLFTAVEAPLNGVVRAILVENEQAVESDQTLILMEGGDDAPPR